ncbi:MAG: VWA domain-containing protein [Sulfurospirillum sp.]
MIDFVHSELLWLIVLLLPLFYFLKYNKKSYEALFAKDILEKIRVKNRGFSKRVRNVLLIASAFFMIIALARPYIDKGEIKVKSSFINVVVGLDISNSMFVNDVYPSRFALAKKKFYEFLKDMKSARVGVVGFSSRSFLVAPLSEDYHSLDFLVKNLSTASMSLRGTDFMSALEAANDLYQTDQKKAFLIFTDGGDQSSFTKEIEYAKKHKIVIFVYAIGTDKGGVIETKNGALKDKNGNIVVVKINENIKKLALGTGGAYMRSTLSNRDIKMLSDAVKARFKAKGSEINSIKEKRELFYYPLSLAILLFFMANFSLRGKRD